MLHTTWCCIYRGTVCGGGGGGGGVCGGGWCVWWWLGGGGGGVLLVSMKVWVDINMTIVLKNNGQANRHHFHVLGVTSKTHGDVNTHQVNSGNGLSNQHIHVTHWGRLTHICVGNLTITGSDDGLNQCSNIINWTIKNTFQWNFSRSSYIFIQENAFECVVCEMSAICLGLNVINCVLLSSGPLLMSVFIFERLNQYK